MNDFWITNISNKVVILSDLNLEIGPYKTINLMDKKHFSYSIEYLNKSENSGSLFKRKNIIKIRKNSPEKSNKNILINNHIYDKENKVWMFDNKGVMPSRNKSVYKIEQEKYEELNVSDIDFAENNAELDINENVDKKA